MICILHEYYVVFKFVGLHNVFRLQELFISQLPEYVTRIAELNHFYNYLRQRKIGFIEKG